MKPKIKEITPKVKIWLEIILNTDNSENPRIIFGKGKKDLLLAIDQTQSISAAAKSLNLNFKTAWRKIKTLNRDLPPAAQLIVSSKGGIDRGGTDVTELGKKLIKSYSDIEKIINAIIEELPTHDLKTSGEKQRFIELQVSNSESTKDKQTTDFPERLIIPEWLFHALQKVQTK